MTPDDFTRYLQGFAELNDKVPTKDQWNTIKQRLDSVFQKVTPVIPNTEPRICTSSKGLNEPPFWTIPQPRYCSGPGVEEYQRFIPDISC